MSLQKWQVEEIAAFDRKKRLVHDFDGRKKRPTRKTLRYNYIVVGGRPRTLAEVFADKEAARPPQWGKLEVTVVHVAVRLNGAYRQVVKEVGRWHIKTGKLELRDIDYHGLGGWIVDWRKEDWAGGGKRKDGKAETAPLVAKPVDDGWYSGGKWKFNVGLTFPWHETINLDALKGTLYEYCQYADDTPCKAGLVDWLMMYRAEPKIELLAKMGLYSLICPAGIKNRSPGLESVTLMTSRMVFSATRCSYSSGDKDRLKPVRMVAPSSVWMMYHISVLPAQP